jgi:hypothetical protein
LVEAMTKKADGCGWISEGSSFFEGPGQLSRFSEKCGLLGVQTGCGTTNSGLAEQMWRWRGWRDC